MNCHFPSIPWETMGRGCEGSSPRTSQKGERRVGGSSIAPKGRGSRSCNNPPQRRGENAERSPRLRAHAGSGDEGRGGSYQTRKPSALGVAQATVPALYPAHLSGRGCGTYGSAAPPRSGSELRPAPPPAAAPRTPLDRGACVLAPGGGVSTETDS